jgi:hypothetical protein
MECGQNIVITYYDGFYRVVDQCGMVHNVLTKKEVIKLIVNSLNIETKIDQESINGNSSKS